MLLWLSEVGKDDVPSVGGKGASLGEMLKAGLPLPSGFCLTARAYRSFVIESGLHAILLSHLAQPGVTSGDAGACEAASRLIREAFAAIPMPASLESQLAEAYDRLGPAVRVAVRSSATAEDLPDASFAGQQETFLNIRGLAPVREHVRLCWSSLWTARAIAYRSRQGYAHDEVALAVVVQQMVDADVAGVLFTVDPVTGQRDRMLVNGSWGLGESVVSGLVTPDTYCISRKPGRLILTATLGSKERRIVPADDGTRTEPVSKQDQQRSCLSEAELRGLLKLGERVERHYGTPQDIEWALSAGQLHLLQARPITTLANSPPTFSRRQRAIVNDLLEHYPDAPTPLDHAAVVEGYEQLQHAMRDLGLSVRSARELMAMDADGVTRIAPQLPVPQLRFLRFPWHIWKAMQSDPAAWRPFGIAAQERQRRLATADLAGLSDADVADQLRRAQDLANDIARVRFAQIILPLFVRGWALQLYGRLAGRKMQPYEWLAGLPYKTVEVEADLQRLADVLLSDSMLAEIVSITPPEKRRTALAGNPAGTAFLALLDDFLNRHGARTMQLYLPYSHRSWREEPEALWATLQAVVRSGEVNAAMHRQRTGEQRYSKLNQELLARLPRFLHGSYRRLTEGYRADHQSREETVYHIEQAFEQARRAMDEAAARLVQRGVLRHSSEVLFLTLDDLLGVLRGTLEGSEATKRAARRRVKQETARTVWRGQKSWPKAISGDALVGVAGSPGSARGPVRKIMKVEDFARLKRGDVLVCPFTDPAWTPLFSLASAVVADTGGPLSHAAIVAREYGIPAVLGTQIGTQRLADDDRVQVDGAEGRVVRLKPAAE